ncbi:MAG: hypothetical protein AAF763_13940 [Pseudomonadota bacterium]
MSGFDLKPLLFRDELGPISVFGPEGADLQRWARHLHQGEVPLWIGRSALEVGRFRVSRDEYAVTDRRAIVHFGSWSGLISAWSVPLDQRSRIWRPGTMVKDLAVWRAPFGMALYPRGGAARTLAELSPWSVQFTFVAECDRVEALMREVASRNGEPAT